MAALVREQRVDKNGNLVTRWVRPDEAPAVPVAIPPVALNVDLPFDRVEYVTELLNFWGEHRTDDFTEDEITDLFWRLDDSTLLAIDIDYQLDSGDGERMTTIFDWVGYFAEEQEEYLRELVTYAGAFADDQSVHFIEESISLLKDSKSLPPMSDYSQAEPVLQQTIRNILSVTEAVFGEEYARTGGADVLPELTEDLRSLVMDRPECTDRIKEIVKSRNTSDAGLVRSILEAEAPAISAGVL